eukprot:11448324-Ditylum_brightwellii.AAC.1
MDESRLPQKFINAWRPKPHPVERPLTNIRHAYLHALQYVKEIPEDDDQDKLNDWMPTIWWDPVSWGK